MTDTHESTPASVWRNPIHFLAFGFGSGAIRPAPGTWGTLAAMPFVLLWQQLPPGGYAAVILLSTLLGIWLCHRTAADLGVHDHGGIVWDEFVGVWINGPQLPMSDALRSWPERQQLDWMLRGGDDYVLLFTLPRAARGQIEHWRQAGQRVSIIGQVQAGQGVQLDLGLGMRPVDGPGGYQHFRSQDD